MDFARRSCGMAKRDMESRVSCRVKGPIEAEGYFEGSKDYDAIMSIRTSGSNL